MARSPHGGSPPGGRGGVGPREAVGNAPERSWLARHALEAVLFGPLEPWEPHAARDRLKSALDAIVAEVRVRDAVVETQVEALLRAYEPLAGLPWFREYLADLVRDLAVLKGGSLTEIGLPLSGVTPGGWVRKVNLAVPAEGSVSVDHTPSRKVQRWRLTEGIRRLRRAGSITGDATKVLLDQIPQTLAVSHRPGRRPYALDGYPGIERDVRAWVVMEIEGWSPKEVVRQNQLAGRLPGSRQGVWAQQKAVFDLLRKKSP